MPELAKIALEDLAYILLNMQQKHHILSTQVGVV